MKEGSLTVEAAFLMPFILFTIFSLIYVAFYLHDVSKIQGIIDDSLKRASLSFKHDADFETGEVNYDNINNRGVFYQIVSDTKQEEETIQNYLQKRLSKGLYLSKITSVNAIVEKRTITITIGIKVWLSMKGVNDLFQPVSNRNMIGSATVHNPAETIRITEIILETGDKLKGMDALKEKLNKFKN